MTGSGKIDDRALRRLLHDLGYTVHFRREGWVECLLRYRRERWLGVGLNEDEAFDAAAREALPSHVARALLARWAQGAWPNQMDGQMDGRANGQADGQADGQAHEQAAARGLEDGGRGRRS